MSYGGNVIYKLSEIGNKVLLEGDCGLDVGQDNYGR